MSPLNKTVIPVEVVMNKIYLVRDQIVMLDEDLAELYGVETRRLNEQVKRNTFHILIQFCTTDEPICP